MNTRNLALLSGLAISAAAFAQPLPSVTRALGGLPTTDTLHGGHVIGLRGDKPGGSANLFARVGFGEPGSDDSRSPNQNGFLRTSPAFSGVFPTGGVRDFSPDGNPTPGNFSSTTNHATHVAGLAVSAAPANSGMAHSAVGYMALFDDLVGYPRLNNSAHFASMESAFDWLTITNPGVNVINASFGFKYKNTPGTFGSTDEPVVLSDLNGMSYPSRLLDYYAWTHDVMTIKSAGNTGLGAGPGEAPYTIGLVTIPGDGFNGLTVGALNLAGNGPAGFSAFSPLADGRNGVHLVASGTNVQSIGFNGTLPTASGTSFAAPQVTGAVANLVSAAKQANAVGGRTDKGDQFSTDPRVLKAVVTNSADKTLRGTLGAAPWTPGRVDPTDNRNWEHPLNYSLGAGELDAMEAWQQFREAGPTLRNPSTPNQVYENRFWDFAVLQSPNGTPGAVNYVTNAFSQFALPQGFWLTSLTATLTWHRHVTASDLGAGVTEIPVSDLDLWFQYSLDNGASWEKILASRSPNDTTEHIFLPNITDGVGGNAIYRLQVWAANGIAPGLNSEGFALAVRYTAIPTPGALSLAVLGIASLVRRRR